MTFHRAHDPVVILQLKFDSNVFDTIFGTLKCTEMKSGLKIKNVELNSVFSLAVPDLQQIFHNSCVVDDSVTVQVRKRRALREFVESDDGRLVEHITEKGWTLAFRFVRTDGKLNISE